MAKILISYTTNEGQVAKVVNVTALQLRALGHTVHSIDLDNACDSPNPSTYDAVIVAASVHAGKHQPATLRFVTRYHAVLQQRLSAFLSVSLSAAATEQAGLNQAGEQIQHFLEQTGWQPDMVEAVAGAFRYSRFSRLWRAIIKFGYTLANKDLAKLGWPDLTRDQEFTNWDALRAFGQRFAERL